MRRMVALLCALTAVAGGVAAYDMSPLRYGLLKVFERGFGDNQLLVATDPSQAGGGPVGPSNMVVSSDGRWIAIADGRARYYDGSLRFRFSWDSRLPVAFWPKIIDGDTAYGTAFEGQEMVFAVVDLKSQDAVVSGRTGVRYTDLAGSSVDSVIFRRTTEAVVFDVHLRSQINQVGRYYVEDGGFEYGTEATEDYLGMVSVPAYLEDGLPSNAYAAANGLVVADWRQYWGDYHGYTVWLSSMSPPGSRYYLSGLFGETAPQTLFVVIGRGDTAATPLKGFYLPPLSHYRYYDPLLAFGDQGIALLMYIDDETKRVHLIRFDLDDLIASLPHGSTP